MSLISALFGRLLPQSQPLCLFLGDPCKKSDLVDASVITVCRERQEAGQVAWNMQCGRNKAETRKNQFLEVVL